MLLLLLLMLLRQRPPAALPWRSLSELPIALLLERALMPSKWRLIRKASKLWLPLQRVPLLGVALRALMGPRSLVRLWRLIMQLMHGPML